MRKNGFWIVIASVMCLGLIGCLRNLALEEKAPKMTKEELKSLLGGSDVIIVDVRLEADWKSTGWKIKGAVREDPEKDMKASAEKYPKDKTLVFYCS